MSAEEVVVEKQVKIKNEMGIHARPSALIVKTAKAFKSDVWLVYEGKKVNARRVMDVLTLAAPKGSVLTVIADGEDEQEALDAMVELIEERKFDEE